MPAVHMEWDELQEGDRIVFVSVAHGHPADLPAHPHRIGKILSLTDAMMVAEADGGDRARIRRSAYADRVLETLEELYVGEDLAADRARLSHRLAALGEVPDAEGGGAGLRQTLRAPGERARAWDAAGAARAYLDAQERISRQYVEWDRNRSSALVLRCLDEWLEDRFGPATLEFVLGAVSGRG